MDRWVVDVTDVDFEQQVVERSRGVPVVVDFWAEWCQPCRQLGPRLEQFAEANGGAFVLAKVDTEAAPETATRFGIRSIPAVMGFRDGEMVEQFVGNQPDAVIAEFLGRLVPTRADELTREADALAARSDGEAAEARYREALAEASDHPGACLGLARALAARDAAAASELLAGARRGTPLDDEIARLEASLRVQAAGGLDREALEARIAEAPDDLDARLSLGGALAAADEHAEALATLLELVRHDPDHDDQAARRRMLDLFELLGADHELTREYRALLARALYR